MQTLQKASLSVTSEDPNLLLEDDFTASFSLFRSIPNLLFNIPIQYDGVVTD